MANALDAPTLHAVLNARPKLTWQDGGYSYSVTSANGASTYAVAKGEDALRLPIRWAFGAHSQTWVLEYNGKLYESRVSFYSSIDALGLTMGDQRLRPAQNIVEAMGRELPHREATTCFECHATHAVSRDHMQLDSLTPGVQCDRCHDGTAKHSEAISQGKLTSLPPKLKQLTAEDIANFCGQCHRSFGEVVRSRLFGSMNVRFQPYRLARSKCFNGNDARISCLACHDPHQKLVQSDATYDVRCLACHAVEVKHCATKATSGCVGCHMPKTQLPGGQQAFTDHYIRVARAGEKYPE
jgi:hypothetical protein